MIKSSEPYTPVTDFCVVCGRECLPGEIYQFDTKVLDYHRKHTHRLDDIKGSLIEKWRDVRCYTCHRHYAIHAPCNAMLVAALQQRWDTSAFNHQFGWCPDCEEMD